MITFVYDGTFEGLLSAIYEAYYSKTSPDRIVCLNDLQQSLLDSYIYIDTVPENSKKVYNSIKDKISKHSLKKVYYTFLSDYEDSGTWIYRYLKLGWKMGSKIDNHLSHERVMQIHKTTQKVLREKHRMLGLLRFEEIYEGVFYAPMEPDHNIIRLVSPHFAQRLSNQHWIIHDVKRRLASVYDQNSWVVKDVDFSQSFFTSSCQCDYQAMWKTYFKSTSIKSRKNLKLQKTFMPGRYWKYLPEKQPK